MHQGLENRVIVVTGGGGPNIGRGVALCLAEAGAAVIVTDVDLAQAEETVRHIEDQGGRAEARALDVRSEEACEALAEEVATTFGRLDGLVASAGIGYEPKTVLERPLHEWQEMLDINLTGLMLTNRACARVMIGAGQPGTIVNIASSATFIAAVGGGHYRAAKAGVWLLTKTLALELGAHGIRVNAIAPGHILPEAVYAAQREAYADELKDIPLGRMGTPRDIGNVAAFLLSEAASFISGEIICVDGGRHADSRS